MQEVFVGDEAVDDELREDEHEALFHRRSRRAQQAPQREEKRGEHDADRDAVSTVEATRPPRLHGHHRPGTGLAHGEQASGWVLIHRWRGA